MPLKKMNARAPTRSPQGGRARQNAAKNPADLHAEGNARGGGERAPASEFHPEPSRGRRRRDGGARNGQPPAQAAPSLAAVRGPAGVCCPEQGPGGAALWPGQRRCSFNSP